MNDIVLDLCGLKCPWPALRTGKALQDMTPGHLLIVECTDPMAAIDIPHLVSQTGDVLEMQTRRDQVLRFHIRRTARPPSVI